MNYPPKLVTIGRIVQEIGEPLHRIEYVLRTRHHIRPAAYAGRVRLYRKVAVAQVRHELNALDARRSQGGAV